MFQKTLIIGGSGLVGRAIIQRAEDFGKVYATYYSTRINSEGIETCQLDVRDANRVNDVVKEIQPDIVINAAAKRNTRYCENNPDEAYKVNVNNRRNDRYSIFGGKQDLPITEKVDEDVILKKY